MIEGLVQVRGGRLIATPFRTLVNHCTASGRINTDYTHGNLFFHVGDKSASAFLEKQINQAQEEDVQE